jgi:hypothetical protein
MKTVLALALSALSIASASSVAAQGGETTAMITEIKLGRGRVEVQSGGAGAWKPARPLLALRAGDVVRVSDDATVVVLFTGGHGTTRVDRASSPFTVPAAQAGEGKAQKARDLLQSSVGYLAGSTHESSHAVLATRGAPRAPLILAPRNSPVLPGPLAFEWLGTRFSHYTIQVLGPDKVAVIGPREVTGSRWELPADAPALSPGTRYVVRVQTPGQAPQEAWFEMVDSARAQAVRADLAALEQTLGADTPPTSVAVVRAGFLTREGLMHDARLALTGALARDPDEPTLHLLLGDIEAKTGLNTLAAQSYQEAEFLLGRR